MVETKKWNFSKTKLLQVFIRDGFIDRYSGEKLIPTGALSVLSELMPEGRLCLRNWWERLKNVLGIMKSWIEKFAYLEN